MSTILEGPLELEPPANRANLPTEVPDKRNLITDNVVVGSHEVVSLFQISTLLTAKPVVPL